jgi:hypothetical protein
MEYFDRRGNPIAELQWENLRATPGYATVRNFCSKTKRVTAIVHWIGTAPAPFVLMSNEGEESFHVAEAGAINAYEDYLVSKGCGEWIQSVNNPDKLHFVEFENALAAPGRRDAEFVDNIVQNANYGSW